MVACTHHRSIDLLPVAVLKHSAKKNTGRALVEIYSEDTVQPAVARSEQRHRSSTDETEAIPLYNRR